jgi:hypothetical protein
LNSDSLVLQDEVVERALRLRVTNRVHRATGTGSACILN